MADIFGVITTLHAYVITRKGILGYEALLDDEGREENVSVTKQYNAEELNPTPWADKGLPLLRRRLSVAS